MCIQLAVLPKDDFSTLYILVFGRDQGVILVVVEGSSCDAIEDPLCRSPTENSLAVLNHKILEANSQVQNVKLGGHPTCLSINRLWHNLFDMLRRLVGTTAPGHHDCSIQE
ncbi:uncharacterized protein TNCV_4019011 [Trichonephila clavipes]|nr:uncharacterized protein TNCV_4019011 [Trichonephila clavipes]